MSSLLANRRLGLRVLCVGAAVAWIVLALLRFVEFNHSLLYAAVPVAPWFVGFFAVGAAATFGWRAVAVTGLVFALALGSAMPGAVLPRTGCAVPVGSEHRSNDETGIVLFSHNVHFGSGDPQQVADQILAVGPDVVLLQEADADFVAGLADNLDDPYPHLAASTALRTTSLATFSRWPLTDVIDTQAEPYDENPFLITTVETPGGSLRVANVHMSAPISDRHRNRRLREFDFMSSGPIVSSVDTFMGDFNASGAHVGLRRFIDNGFHDAHREIGCGLGMTWSHGGAGWPGLLSLDHLLSTDRVTVESFQILDYASSDHKAIAAEVRLGG